MDVEKKQAKLAKVNAAIEKLKDQRDKIERELEDTDLSVWNDKFAGKIIAIHDHTLTKNYNASSRIVGKTTYARVIGCTRHDRFGHITLAVNGAIRIDTSEDGTVDLTQRTSTNEVSIHELDLIKKFTEIATEEAVMAHIAKAEAATTSILYRMREIIKEKK